MPYEINSKNEVVETLVGGLKRKIAMYGFECGTDSATKLDITDMVRICVSVCILNPDGTESVNGYSCGNVNLDFHVPYTVFGGSGTMIDQVRKVFQDHFIGLNDAPDESSDSNDS